MSDRMASPRRSVLDLAPLELDCMNTLWPMGEGTVREIRDRLAPRRPRAYTTIMTIMDRLARKGVVERRKAGRAYVYRPNLSAEDARSQALSQVIENFYGGSREAMLAELAQPALLENFKARAAVAAASAGSYQRQMTPAVHAGGAADRALARPAALSVVSGGTAVSGAVPAPAPARRTRRGSEATAGFESAERIDETLL
jgi:BlaI family transcriptional regulator, penicillinase repressor